MTETEQKSDVQTTSTELTAEEIAELVADAPASPIGEAFYPTDSAGVDWVLAKMSAARAEAALIRQNAELMARECERRAEHLDWKYGAALQTWLRAELGGGKKKSVRLYHGVVGYRQKPAGVSITDAAAAGQWAEQHCPDALVTHLDKKALGAALLDTGEAVSFAEFLPAEDVFYIKS